MPKTQFNAFKSMFLILISNNLLIYKIDQINQISIFSFYFSTFFRKAFPHDLFCPFSSAIYFRITYLSHAASAGDLPLKCQTFHYGISRKHAVKTSPRFTAPRESFAVEFVKICCYKTFWMRIFERTTFLHFRCCSIHVKLCILATYSARN